MKLGSFLILLSLLLSSMVFLFRLQSLNYVLVLILLLFNVYCIATVLRHDVFKFSRLTIAIVLFCIWTIYCWLIAPKYQNGVSTSQFMTATVKSLTSIISVFLVTISGNLKSKTLRWISWILLFIVLANYFEAFSSIEVSKYGTSNNAGYTLIYVLFLLCLSGFNKWTNLLFFIIFGLVILSAKRGAILCMLCVSLIYITYRYGKSRKFLLFRILIVLGLLFGIANYVYENNTNLQTKMERTVEGNTSGREYMYGFLWQHFKDSSISEKIFGYQFGSSIKFLGLDAHNDWLEILTSQGILGVVLYSFVLINLWAIYIRRRNFLLDHEKFIIVGGLLMWLIKSCVSQTVYASGNFYYAIAYGFVIAQSYLREKRRWV